MNAETVSNPGKDLEARIWRTPEGTPVACTEKIKVLNENLEELRE